MKEKYKLLIKRLFYYFYGEKFFKRTKKVKLTAPQGTNIWRCEQLN